MTDARDLFILINIQRTFGIHARINFMRANIFPNGIRIKCLLKSKRVPHSHVECSTL